jgi:hypothetical protein
VQLLALAARAALRLHRTSSCSQALCPRAGRLLIPPLPPPCRDPYIIGGSFIWGCSLNDYAGCLQDAKQGDNSRHCLWDEKNNLCIIDPMRTQNWILDK